MPLERVGQRPEGLEKENREHQAPGGKRKVGEKAVTMTSGFGGCVLSANLASC